MIQTLQLKDTYHHIPKKSKTLQYVVSEKGTLNIDTHRVKGKGQKGIPH